MKLKGGKVQLKGKASKSILQEIKGPVRNCHPFGMQLEVQKISESAERQKRGKGSAGELDQNSNCWHLDPVLVHSLPASLSNTVITCKLQNKRASALKAQFHRLLLV